MPRKRSRSRRPYGVLLVGRNSRSLRFIEIAQSNKSGGVQVVGVLDNGSPNRSASTLAARSIEQRLGVPHLGDLSNLRRVLTDKSVQEVHVTLPVRSCYDSIQRVVETCRESGTLVTLSNEIFTGAPLAAKAGQAVGFDDGRGMCATCWMKRGLDIVGALVGLMVFAIPMMIIAALVKLSSRGPALFVQERLGKDHRPFPLYKFRTMVANAEDLRAKLDAENEMSGPVFKIKNDPRITKIGRFLRRTSLDELPQLLNVLKGDMSIVGPRPPLASEVREYEWWQRRRLSVRPGLTCFWQISGRNEISFDEWMRLDLRYIDEWSIGLDIALIARTIPAVLSQRGAA